MSVQRAGEDRKVLRLGVGHRLEERSQPTRVGRDRLFGEDMLPGGHAGGGVERAEHRRRAQQDDFAVRLDHLPVTVGAAERHLLVHAVLAAHVQGLVAEVVRRRDEQHIVPQSLRGDRNVADGAAGAFAAEPVAAPAAASDQPHLEHALRAARPHNPRYGRGRGRRRTQKRPP